MRKRHVSLFIVAAIVLASAASAQDAESVYQKIRSLPEKQRQQVLVQGAKKEGSLTLYAVFVRPVMEAFLQSFNEKYPFIKTQFIREGRGDALAERYLTEHRAGRQIADVLAGGDNAVLSLLEAKVLAAYESPERKYFPRDYKDKEGRWTTIFISEWAFGYNTTMVDRNKLPKTYLDLLDPYWKGKIGLDPLPNNFVRGALKAFGEKKSLDFFNKLVETQDIQFRRGRTLQTQLLAAGEFAASPELRLSILKEMKQGGAPVDYHFAYPFPTTMAALSIFKATKSPHAAALLVDFWLSKEGQQFLIDKEFTVVREGMMQLDAEGIKNLVPLDLEFRAATDEWVRKVTTEVFSSRARGR